MRADSKIGMTLVGLSMAACLAAGCAAQAPEPVGSTASGLTLSEKSKERVAGEFSQDGVTVRFDAVRTGSVVRFAVDGGDGVALVHGDQVKDDFVTSVLSGRLVITYTSKVADGVSMSGDERAMAELEARREYALLPKLSAELGKLGINGRDYPAVLSLHLFNRAVAERLDLEPGADDDIEASPGGEDPGYCTAYPNSGNQCYGMCGRGCSCWSWVCGDCCYHNGCARHDNYCRGGGIWDTAKCWTTWGATVFGC